MQTCSSGCLHANMQQWVLTCRHTAVGNYTQTHSSDAYMQTFSSGYLNMQIHAAVGICMQTLSSGACMQIYEGVPAGIRQGSQPNEETRVKTQCRLTSSTWIRLRGALLPGSSSLANLKPSIIWGEFSRQQSVHFQVHNTSEGVTTLRFFYKVHVTVREEGFGS